MSAVFLAFAGASSARANETDASVVSIKTPRGVTQKLILLKPAKPAATVILFAGGKGALGITGPSAMEWGAGNFLVRTRARFLAEGFMVAVVDAPSDRSGGMNAIFRISRAHADDIRAVVARLKEEAPLPVWLVGTSRGTISAARGAIDATDVAGLVLTATITRERRDAKIYPTHPHGVASMALSRVKVPTLIVSHRNDGCAYTPSADTPKLQRALTGAPKVAVEIVDGGLPPISEPCQAKSEHGFLGIEREVVSKIAQFIRAATP